MSDFYHNKNFDMEPDIFLSVLFFIWKVCKRKNHIANHHEKFIFAPLNTTPTTGPSRYNVEIAYISFVGQSY